ncbi:acetoin utilization protein AcuC [Nakamurella endophytica]|uniref:Acetoin utilization protein AcuC n=1 Tax=Nakamurella endophytica TaxID=1748367 RepID=A0A917WKG2_9ACTN|nr:acetoin utilization protein AcuC [Nakamurella endophytica]GGM11684.1 acetoin utilization protein AcuC [Nakamurella endophytica]
MAAPLVVWDPAMAEYDLGGRHPLHPLRWQLTWSLARSLGVLDGVDLVPPPPATDDELLAVHRADYLAAVHAASAVPPLRHPGHGLGTTDNPVFPDMHRTAALITGGSIAAARAIARGQVRRAVNIAGGLHHAMADHASGFCVYNDPALAIHALLDEGVRRVAYVDVDVHHGDGVQAAFYDDPRVLTVSLHQSPATLWPGTGWPAEVGAGAAAGTAVNVPVPAGTGDRAWLRAFRAVVPGVLRAFRPDVLVTQHGADSHAEDPLADLRLTVDGHRTAQQELRALAEELTGGRWLALGGGGYALVRVVPRSWTHLLAAVLDRDLDPRTPVPADWQEEARQSRPGTRPPEDMSDGSPDGIPVTPWSGETEEPVDVGIDQVRRAVFPLHGLDPFDPRD